jgi:hypothetical protein
MYEDHMMLGAAMLFWALVETDQQAADSFFLDAVTYYRDSSELQERCGLPLASWDAPCPHAMLLLVQASGHYDSLFGILLRDFAEKHVGYETPNGNAVEARDGLMYASPLLLECSCDLHRCDMHHTEFS